MLTDYTDYLTPYEAADEFGISLTTVYNLLRAKKIPGFKIGKSWRIPKDAMEVFIYGDDSIQAGQLANTTHRQNLLIFRGKGDIIEIEKREGT